MSQTSYSASRDPGVAGQIIENGSTASLSNAQGTALPFGVLVVYGDSDDEVISPASASAVATKAAGVTAFSHSYEAQDEAGALGIPDGDDVSALKSGTILVKVEEAVGVDDDVYARITSDGSSNTQLGAFRASADSGRAVRITGAKFEKAASSGGLARLRVTAPLGTDALES